jgi:hypothetical protein
MTTKRRPAPSGYHLLSLREKQAGALAHARESAIRCEQCQTQVMPAEYLRHRETRCAGRPEPDARSTWLTWSQALNVGVGQHTLSGWVRDGFVRVRGEKAQRRYLLADLVLWVDRQREMRAAIARRARVQVRGESLGVQLEMPFARRHRR